MKRIAVVLAFLACSSCATSGSKQPAEVAGQLPTAKLVTAPPASLVSTSWGGRTADSVRSGSCPTSLPAVTDVEDDLKHAVACVAKGQWAQVEELGNRMSIQFVAEPWGPYFLSLSAEHGKDLPRARWMAELALRKAPNEGIALYQLGRLQWLMNEHHAASETIEKAASHSPGVVEAQVFLGRMDLLADHNADAAKHFQLAVDHDSGHLQALLGGADAYGRVGNWAQAEKFLRSAISEHPKSLQPRVQLAQGLEFKAHDFSAALQVYKDIQRMSSDHRLDASPSLDVAAKIQLMNSNIADELKRQAAARKPSNQEVQK